MSILPARALAHTGGRHNTRCMTSRALPGLRPRTASGTQRAVQSRALADGAVYAFDVSRGASVTCLDGELWVTGPDTGDRILLAGQGLKVEGRGRVVIQALTAARFAAKE